MTAPAPLRERARTGAGSAELLLFRAGGERFALALADVEEAIDLTGVALHDVPRRGAALLGVVALRGSLMPLYDAAVPLGLARGDTTTALVFRRGDARMALAVEDADDVLVADLAALRPPPHAGGDARAALLLGVLQHDSDLVGVLDGEALLAACRAESPETQ